MTVLVEQGLVILSGRCAVEDAEQLLMALQDAPGSIVDLSGATRLHTAVVQIILSVRPPMRGCPDDPILQEFVLPGVAKA
jgi:hypothetical protein